METLSNLAFGLGVALSWQNILYCFIGCFLGTLVGVLPGIGPVATVAMQVEIRESEQRAFDLFLQNLVKGTSHLSLGQEAVAAGFAAAMKSGDLSFCTYRGHAHTLARGVPIEKVLGELMQRDNGLMYGVREFAAIINPPQATILAVGAARRQAVESEDGGVAFTSVLSVTLSCDHRVVDGALGAELIAAFRELVAQPVTMRRISNDVRRRMLLRENPICCSRRTAPESAMPLP